MGMLIDKHTGIAKLRPKQGEKPKQKRQKVKPDEIEMCLNCKAPNCKGTCKKIRGLSKDERKAD